VQSNDAKSCVHPKSASRLFQLREYINQSTKIDFEKQFAKCEKNTLGPGGEVYSTTGSSENAEI
jgi:hypothetical protein